MKAISRKKRNGFTLVELIVVIAIIGILSAVLIPSVSGYIDRARDSSALQEVNVIATTTYQAWVIDMESQHPGEGVTDQDFYAYVVALNLLTGSAGMIPLEDEGVYTYEGGFYYKATNGRIIEVSVNGQQATTTVIAKSQAELTAFETAHNFEIANADPATTVIEGEFHRGWNRPLISVLGDIPGTGVLGWRAAPAA
jgi:prepilin-type N-terminal cleavage/methylation domain-containing protein